MVNDLIAYACIRCPYPRLTESRRTRWVVACNGKVDLRLFKIIDRSTEESQSTSETDV